MINDRTCLIATQHKKEQVIAPILNSKLGVTCFVSNELNTDQFGTFSGEIERTFSPLNAARAKCDLAHQHTGCDLVLANEGSFGPHPNLFFIPVNEELMLLRDYKNNLSIWTSILSTETNFNSLEISNANQLGDFAKSIGFPSHKLILLTTDRTQIRKDFNTLEEANHMLVELTKGTGRCIVETDMRAMNNPTRMNVIEELTHKLVKKVNSKCPSCNTPGFDVIQAISGLPCMGCKSPTSSTLSLVKGCISCNHEELIEYPNNKVEEDPMYCNYCNP
ncbi:MAG: hypothetical protein RLZZ382_992 [Bacteroidota bacterium]